MSAPIRMPRGYLSDKEFDFDEKQADAIVRTVAYSGQEYGQSVIWFPPKEHVGIRSSLATPFQRLSSAALGSLDRLPLEILQDILLRLDLHSLLRFRQSNNRSREAVHSLRQYQLAVSHGLNALCALLRTRLAFSVSLPDFYRTLCTEQCAMCGGFGGFMSLLTWTRCCFRCLQVAAETRVQSLASARKRLKLNRRHTIRLKTFKTLPGAYTMLGSMYKSRITVVSAQQAMSISGQNPRAVIEAVTEADKDFLFRNERFNFMASCALPYYDGRSGNVECGVLCAGCQLAIERRIIANKSESWAYEARDKIYSQDGFLAHFRRCEQAQLLWISSDQGKREPPELPETARRRPVQCKRIKSCQGEWVNTTLKT